MLLPLCTAIEKLLKWEEVVDGGCSEAAKAAKKGITGCMLDHPALDPGCE